MQCDRVYLYNRYYCRIIALLSSEAGRVVLNGIKIEIELHNELLIFRVIQRNSISGFLTKMITLRIHFIFQLYVLQIPVIRNALILCSTCKQLSFYALSTNYE